MFCLVAITYTSPKVSMTANKLVPRKKKEEGPRGFKFEICIKSNQESGVGKRSQAGLTLLIVIDSSTKGFLETFPMSQF